MKSWQLQIDEDGVVTLPDDLMTEAGWTVGDVLHYIDNYDGSYSIVKEDLTNFIKKGIINNGQDKNS
jgi:hypothetical protein